MPYSEETRQATRPDVVTVTRDENLDRNLDRLMIVSLVNPRLARSDRDSDLQQLSH
jgi:hypothetical protein